MDLYGIQLEKNVFYLLIKFIDTKFSYWVGTVAHTRGG